MIEYVRELEWIQRLNDYHAEILACLKEFFLSYINQQSPRECSNNAKNNGRSSSNRSYYTPRNNVNEFEHGKTYYADDEIRVSSTGALDIHIIKYQ